MIETSRLYECRTCGGLAASTHMACPYCKSSSGGTKTIGTFDGGSKEVERQWYRVVELRTDD